jgi:inhibitor of KinA sporulation pathway (predicted exonuclease)
MKTSKGILVIDVESTCWETRDEQNAKTSEIIEIGMVLVGAGGVLRGVERNLVVRPQFSEVSTFCTTLTTITQDEVDTTGISFLAAIADMKACFRLQDVIFASWGDYDRKMFRENCTLHQLRYPFSNQHLNVKALFAAIYGKTGGQQECGETLGITMEGTAHRALPDARNIAKILSHLLTR